MPKFWAFEKTGVLAYMSSRPDYVVSEFMDEEEQKAINKSLRYGTNEYLRDSVLFKPSKEDCRSIELTLFLGNDEPSSVLRKLLKNIAAPYYVHVD